MAVDIVKLFNEELPAAIAAKPEEAKAIGATYNLKIAGAGDWHINASATGASCEPGEKPADCTISIASDDFQTLLANPQSAGMQLFFAGKLKVQGNQMLAMKLQKLFDLAK